MTHHAQVFFDENGAWGWQCFQVECKAEGLGFADIHTAQAAADEHMREAS